MVDSFSMTVSALNRPHRGLLMFIILWIISFITFAFCHTCQPQLLNDGWLLLNDCHCAWMHSLSTLYDYNSIHYLNHRFCCSVCIGWQRATVIIVIVTASSSWWHHRRHHCHRHLHYRFSMMTITVFIVLTTTINDDDHCRHQWWQSLSSSSTPPLSMMTITVVIIIVVSSTQGD